MTGTSSIGTQVQIGEIDGVFVDLGCTVKASLPGPETQFVEDKCLGQTSRGISSIATWINLGMLTLTLKYGQDAYEQLLDWQNDSLRLFVKLTFPKQLTDAGILQATAAVAEFRAYIQQPQLDFPEDGGRVPIDLTLKVDSDIDFTPGTSIS